MTQTRAEKTAYMRQWSREKMKDPEARAKKAAYQKQWMSEHRAERKTQGREWYLANRSEILAQNKAFRKDNPDWCREEAIRRKTYRRDHHLRTKYNTTPERIYELIEEQKRACAICHEPFPSTDRPLSFWGIEFHIDHCHKTIKVRGLLCFSCNQGIGSLKDSAANAQSAADYLKKHSTP